MCLMCETIGQITFFHFQGLYYKAELQSIEIKPRSKLTKIIQQKTKGRKNLGVDKRITWFSWI